jgi:hypothetical protein
MLTTAAQPQFHHFQPPIRGREADPAILVGVGEVSLSSPSQWASCAYKWKVRIYPTPSRVGLGNPFLFVNCLLFVCVTINPQSNPPFCLAWREHEPSFFLNKSQKTKGFHSKLILVSLNVNKFRLCLKNSISKCPGQKIFSVDKYFSTTQ